MTRTSLLREVGASFRVTFHRSCKHGLKLTRLACRSIINTCKTQLWQFRGCWRSGESHQMTKKLKNSVTCTNMRLSSCLTRSQTDFRRRIKATYILRQARRPQILNRGQDFLKRGMFNIIVLPDIAPQHPQTRRSHRKSRHGCTSCKERRMKVRWVLKCLGLYPT
jgi:hypothetical protein